ncbi:MAG: hypothetical protein V3U66_05320 [Acidobacteriota bacterium]
MLAFFFLQLGLGIPACTALVPSRLLGRGFFLLNGGISLVCLSIAAWLPLVPDTAGRDRLLIGITGVCLIITLGLPPRIRQRAGLAILGAGLLCGYLVLLHWSGSQFPPGSGPASPLLLGVDAVLGSVLLGSVLVAMNLGHWYLVIPSLPVSILKRLTLLFVLALTARILLVGTVSVLIWRESLALPENYLLANGVFLMQRILFGFAVPIMLSVLIWKTVAMRSIQSATGLLYVTVFFILMGELVARHLRFISGIPF